MTLLKTLLKAVVDNLDIEFLRVLPAKVVAQASDGTVEVQCFWGRISGCKIVVPLPGATIKVQPGAECLVCWPKFNSELGHELGGRPVVVGFLSGALVEFSCFPESAPIARQGDALVVDQAAFAAWVVAVHAFCMSANNSVNLIAANTAYLTQYAVNPTWPPTSPSGRVTGGSPLMKG